MRAGRSEGTQGRRVNGQLHTRDESFEGRGSIVEAESRVNLASSIASCTPKDVIVQGRTPAQNIVSSSRKNSPTSA